MTEVSIYAAAIAGAAGVAGAASQLAALAVQNTNMQAGEMDPKPDLESLTKSIRAYRDAVVQQSAT
jgi:hypothetical protein